MIRLNVFFEKKECVKAEELNALCEELVKKSLKDNGNVAYDYFVSGTRNGVMMICETWQNEEVLKAHMATDVSVSAMLVDTRQKKYRSSFYS